MLKEIIQQRLTDTQVVPEATISRAVFKARFSLGHTQYTLSYPLLVPASCLTMLIVQDLCQLC